MLTPALARSLPIDSLAARVEECLELRRKLVLQLVEPDAGEPHLRPARKGVQNRARLAALGEPSADESDNGRHRRARQLQGDLRSDVARSTRPFRWGFTPQVSPGYIGCRQQVSPKGAEHLVGLAPIEALDLD
jgi:hypothetical protein